MKGNDKLNKLSKIMFKRWLPQLLYTFCIKQKQGIFNMLTGITNVHLKICKNEWPQWNVLCISLCSCKLIPLKFNRNLTINKVFLTSIFVWKKIIIRVWHMLSKTINHQSQWMINYLRLIWLSHVDML